MSDNKLNLARIKEEFDSLTEKGQWGCIMQYKEAGVITLDNDNTSFHFKQDENADHLLYFKADIGSRSGAMMLLSNLGFNVEQC